MKAIIEREEIIELSEYNNVARMNIRTITYRFLSILVYRSSRKRKEPLD